MVLSHDGLQSRRRPSPKDGGEVLIQVSIRLITCDAWRPTPSGGIPFGKAALCANSAAASTRVRTMSHAAHNKIAPTQRARWAKTRAQQKKAA